MSAAATTGKEWVDRKRYLWILGPGLPVIGLAAILVFAVTGWGVVAWTGPLLLFIVIPAMDLIWRGDKNNPPEDVIEALENDKYYRYLTYAFIPLQYLGFVLAMCVIAGFNPLHGISEFFGVHDWVAANISSHLVEGDDFAPSLANKFAFAFTFGVIGGIAINTAHELGHKKVSLERWLARIALAQAFYGHFYVEHNRGHHVRVATPPDPASARMGETFYEFWPRTVWGSLKSAWELEAKRFERLGTSKWSIKNDNINAWLMSVVLYGAIIVFLGPTIIPWLILQGVVAFSMLEIINYIEHYGMLRSTLESGRFERVSPAHSWNSNNLVTNIFLYHLQRHSDHHANPTRRYQALRDLPTAPSLPTGYAGMIDLALFPWLWRRVVDPLVLKHVDGDLSRVNLSPRVRKKYEAKYGAGSSATAAA